MCNCIEKANEALASRHTAIATKLAISFGDGDPEATMRQVIVIPTVSTKKGKKPVTVPINFCPLCGEKAA